MGLNEADTRAKLIDPLLHAAGWTEELIEREYPYRSGRVLLLGDVPVREAAQYADYVLRDRLGGAPLAIVEAKDEDHGSGAGLQQAVDYARGLGVVFAYSCNGHGIVEQDLTTGRVTEIEEFPDPAGLALRLTEARPMSSGQVQNRCGDTVPNPLLQPVFRDPSGRRLRYYQEAAVAAVIEQLLTGHHRTLLTMATGTGKTLVASAFTWKLRESGYLKRVLFLVDRIALLQQAFNRFAPFGDARGVVEGSRLPLKRDVHFATYQALYSPDDKGNRLYRRYPSDYFDLIVIDECHRSGYGDWREITDYFDTAFHVGMTATPKRTDSIDTYEFFASENRGDNGEPLAAYTYSFGAGIDDGFLATYQVHRVTTNLDRGLVVEEEVSGGAELFVPDDADVKDVYSLEEFERLIVIPDRTDALCEHLCNRLTADGVWDRTIVFCVTMEHAQRVRDVMQNRLGPLCGTNEYAVRIVSEERDAQDLLELFQDSSRPTPVLATTVDLLTTGIDIPSVKNIVFMKPVASPTVFKQIIGRGSRIDEPTAKLFFRIIDYTNATRLLDEWDVPPNRQGASYEPGDGVLAGLVIDDDSDVPLEGAVVAVAAGVVERKKTRTDDGGSYELDRLPTGSLAVVCRANGYRPRRTSIEMAEHCREELVFRLKKAVEATQPLRISGVDVQVLGETVLTLDIDGQGLSTRQYIDFVGEQVRTSAGSLVTLASLWRDPTTRQQFREQMRERHADPAILALIMQRGDADEFDLLANAAFGSRLQTREERARGLLQRETELLPALSKEEVRLVSALLDKYRIGGVEEIATAEVFSVPPFSDEYGGLSALARRLGGPERLRALLEAVQANLYPIVRATA